MDVQFDRKYNVGVVHAVPINVYNYYESGKITYFRWKIENTSWKVRGCTVFTRAYGIYNHRRTDRGNEGGFSPPPAKFWATQMFWAARENLGKAIF